MATDSLDMKLFSFREWQRYIECRRNILVNTHFPTKLRHDPDAPGNAHLYLRFVKSIQGKQEGDVPEITNYKNRIPRELANAMKQCLGQINANAPSLKEAEIFQSSLTPEYSYLEQLQEHPFYDLPDVLKTNFVDSKVSYLTKPKKLKKLAAKYDINVEVVNSSLHFLDKILPQFEKPRLPTIKELNELVKVKGHVDPRKDFMSKTEDVTTYLNRKNHGLVRLDPVKQTYYESIQNSIGIEKNLSQTVESAGFEVTFQRVNSVLEQCDDFDFEKISSNGKLVIPDDCDSDENDDNRSLMNEFPKKYSFSDRTTRTTIESNEIEVLDSQSDPEIEENLSTGSEQNKKLSRDARGRFVRPDFFSRKLDRTGDRNSRNLTQKKFTRISVKDKVAKEDFVSNSDDSDRLFRPYNDYWMYHCIFSRVKPKNFELFEAELPVSFQWLLNECANIVEMSTEDLYEQVCLIETYHAHVLKPADSKRASEYDYRDINSKIRRCKMKW